MQPPKAILHGLIKQYRSGVAGGFKRLPLIARSTAFSGAPKGSANDFRAACAQGG